MKIFFKDSKKPVPPAETKREPKPVQSPETTTPSELKATDRQLKRQIQIHIPKENVQAAFQKSYRDIGKNVRITGFRPGKAPIEAIRKTHHYNKIQETTLYLLLEEFYGKAIQEEKLHPAGEPKLLSLHLKENQAGSIKLELDVHPQFTVKNYRKLKLKKRDTEVTQKQIDSALEKLKRDFTQYEPAKTKCFNQEELIGVFLHYSYTQEGKQKVLTLVLKKMRHSAGKKSYSPRLR